jgi:hypothetical protein
VTVSALEIARTLGCSSRTVWTAISALKDRGLITVSGRQGSRTKFTIIDPKHRKPASQVPDKHVKCTSQEVCSPLHKFPILSLSPERKLNKKTEKASSWKSEKLVIQDWYLTEFWPLWQKAKNDSRAAGLRAAFSKCKSEAIRGQVIAGVKSQAQRRAVQDPAYRAHASTFLNQERWTDGNPMTPQPEETSSQYPLVPEYGPPPEESHVDRA